MIALNQVLKLSDNTVVRVLWIDEKYSYAYVSSIDKSSMPEKFKIVDIKQDSEVVEDPYIYLIDDTFVLEKHKVARDKAWEKIKSLVAIEPEIYMENQRGRLIKNACETSGINKKIIYEYLKKYWRKGMIKNALLPDYSKCGKNKITVVKPGRKRQFPDLEGEGIAITPDILKIFEKVFKEHYKNAQRRSLASSYRKMIADYFYDKGDAVPSYRQFLRRRKDFYTKEEALRAKVGDKAFNKDNRVLTSNSTKEVLGPGSKYQIDATVADVYLASEMNRSWIVGRPVVYFCIDVFSRMVAGIYVGLEGPSMASARLAILNCIQDKKSYCSEFGIDIATDDWPVHNLPKAFLADNGEMKGVTAENMIQKFGIEIQTAGSYRADGKGIVERHFRTVHDYVKPEMPGFILPDFRQRGGHDYRLDGKLNLREFTQLIIESILQHNKKVINNYPFDKDLANSEVLHTPAELWKWGVRNRSGHLKHVDETQLKAALLKHKTVTASRRGLKLYNELYYTLPLAISEGWFVYHENKKYMKFDIAYNPRDLTEVYVRYKNNYYPAVPANTSDKYKYFAEDCVYYDKELIRQKKGYSSQERKDMVKAQKQLQAITQQASEKFDAEVLDPKSSKRIQKIRPNRTLEKAQNRQKTSSRQQGESAEIININKKEPDNSKKAIADKLRKLRNKKYNKDD